MRPSVSSSTSVRTARLRRREHDGATGLLLDAPDVAPSERREIDLAVRAGCDPVWSRTAWRIEYGHRAALRVEATEHAALAGEPQCSSVAIEHGGVEIRVAPIRG